MMPRRCWKGSEECGEWSEERMKVETVYRVLRRLAQVAVFAGFCVLPWLTAKGLGASGSLFALDLWGLPFADPAAAFQVAVCGGSSGGKARR